MSVYLPNNLIMHLKQLFDMIDVENTGNIFTDDLLDISLKYQSKYFSPNLPLLYADIDPSLQGKLSFFNFTHVLGPLILIKTFYEQVDDVFILLLLDQSQKGFMSFQELFQILQKFDSNLTLNDVIILCQQFAPNCDKITPEIFKSVAQGCGLNFTKQSATSVLFGQTDEDEGINEYFNLEKKINNNNDDEIDDGEEEQTEQLQERMKQNKNQKVKDNLNQKTNKYTPIDQKDEQNEEDNSISELSSQLGSPIYHQINQNQQLQSIPQSIKISNTCTFNKLIDNRDWQALRASLTPENLQTPRTTTSKSISYNSRLSSSKKISKSIHSESTKKAQIPWWEISQKKKHK